MQYDEAVKELKKKDMMDTPTSDQLKAIVSSAVELDTQLRDRDKEVVDLRQKLHATKATANALKEELDEAQKGQEPVEGDEKEEEAVDTHTPSSLSPILPYEDVDPHEMFDSPYEAFVAIHLVQEEGASVDRSRVGDLWRLFYTGDGSNGNKRNKMYAYLAETYDIEVDHDNNIQDMRLRSYNERIERYCRPHDNRPANGQTRLIPEDTPIHPDKITKRVIAQWLGSELGTFHTARQWLKIGRQIPTVRAMLGFRMQHIDDDSTDGRSKSVGRLLAPYVGSDEVFHINGITYEMCSRTGNASSCEYALRPTT